MILMKMYFIIVIFCMFLLSSHALTAFKYKTKDSNIFPQIIKLEIPIKHSHTLSLELTKPPQEIQEPEVVADDREGSMVVKGPDKSEPTAVYKNEKYKATFTVTIRQNATDKNFIYMGGFLLEKREYNLMPSDFNVEAVGDEVEEAWDVRIGGKTYKVSKLMPENNLILKDDLLYASTKDTESYADIFKEVGGVVDDKAEISRQVAGKQQIIAEILLVIDASTYKKFFKFCKNNHKSTVWHIKFYYSHLMNGVSDRYQRVQHNEFSMNTVVTAIYIARNEAEAPFTNNRKSRLSAETLSAQRTLEELNKWIVDQIRSRKINWPSFDLAVLFHDLVTPGMHGLAFVSSACFCFPVGIVANSGTFPTTWTAAHEIGHIMGSTHDKSEHCMPSHPYIMADGLNRDLDKLDNSNLFSPCTIKQFAVHIRKINSINKNCLLNKPSHLLQPLNGKTNAQTMLGQKYDPNQQCAIIFGKTSTFCGTEREGDALCRNIRCSDPLDNYCSWSKNHRAMEGTSCGNRMWCMAGKCVSDSKAPSFSVKRCPYEDSKEVFQLVDMKQMSCAKVKQQPRLCYKEDLAAKCCKTCVSVEDRSHPACPYGDRVDSCSSNSCYYKDYRKECCNTCQRKANGCFGPDKNDCPKDTGGCVHENMKNMCCNMCSNTQTNGETDNNCQDKADWCSQYVSSVPGSCGKSEVKDLCCGTCRT